MGYVTRWTRGCETFPDDDRAHHSDCLGAKLIIRPFCLHDPVSNNT
jgi:hypothetical protein